MRVNQLPQQCNGDCGRQMVARDLLPLVTQCHVALRLADHRWIGEGEKLALVLGGLDALWSEYQVYVAIWQYLDHGL